MSAPEPIIDSREQARSVLRAKKVLLEEVIRDSLKAIDFLRQDSIEGRDSAKADRYQKIASKIKRSSSTTTDACDEADNIVSTDIVTDSEIEADTNRWLKGFKRNGK